VTPDSPRSSFLLLARDARSPLLATLAFVVVVALTPLGAWKLLAAEGLVLALVIGLTGLDPRDLARRWARLFVLVGSLALLLSLGHPLRARLGLPGVLAALLARNALALLALVVLGRMVSFASLLVALRRLHVPPILVATLHFMHRYLDVLASERDRMHQARRARTFTRRGDPAWFLKAGLIGHLLVRALERGERVHAAMTARGWNGDLALLDGEGGDPS
jgi:cobalt/nickel transport system permease protein